jgi:hypothetical protein
MKKKRPPLKLQLRNPACIEFDGAVYRVKWGERVCSVTPSGKKAFDELERLNRDLGYRERFMPLRLPVK